VNSEKKEEGSFTILFQTFHLCLTFYYSILHICSNYCSSNHCEVNSLEYIIYIYISCDLCEKNAVYRGIQNQIVFPGLADGLLLVNSISYTYTCIVHVYLSSKGVSNFNTNIRSLLTGSFFLNDFKL
jgi:hypothetical protein